MMAKGSSGIPLETSGEIALGWHAAPAAVSPSPAATPTAPTASDGTAGADVDMSARGERGEED